MNQKECFICPQCKRNIYLLFEWPYMEQRCPRCNRKIGINSKNEIYMIKSLTNKPFKKRCPQCKNKRKYSEHENILFIKVGNKRICKWCYERSLLFLKSISYILNKYLK